MLIQPLLYWDLAAFLFLYLAAAAQRVPEAIILKQVALHNFNLPPFCACNGDSVCQESRQRVICRGFAGDPQAQIERELDKSRSRKRPTFGAPLVAVTLPRDARCPRRTVAAAFFVSARSDPLRSLPAPASIRSAPHHSHYQRKSSAFSFLHPFQQSVASAMAASLPANVTVCSHACIRVKLSKLRSSSTPPKETKSLVHELTLLLAADALSRALTTTVAGQDVSPLGRSFDVHRSSPERIVIVPILRSGLAMVEGTPCPSPPPNTSIPSHPSAITHTPRGPAG